MGRIVIALGGNAIAAEGSSFAAQQDAVYKAVEQLTPLFEEHEVVLTHGNGPQVGTLLLQEEAAGRDVPLDVLVAETQAQIGYLLQQALQHQGLDATTVLTQVVVDETDAAFDTPTKPVGPWYTGEEAEEKPFPVKKVGSGKTAWRRVVPSPTPRDIVETDIIAGLVSDGRHVICCGGGGIPVTRTRNTVQGVEAVVDKDRTASLLATDIGADMLLILTDVPYVYRSYGADDQEPLQEVSVEELELLLAEEAFDAGSMQPKVEACTSFIADGGQRAVITDPAHASAAVRGGAGTQVTAT